MEAGKCLGPRPELVGGGLIRSQGGWSAVWSLRQRGAAAAYDERILGGGDFVQAVLEEADHRLARQIRARKKTGSLARIIKGRCREAGVTERELRSGSRRRAVSELRRSLCVHLYRELGIPLAKITRQVGTISKKVPYGFRCPVTPLRSLGRREPGLPDKSSALLDSLRERVP